MLTAAALSALTMGLAGSDAAAQYDGPGASGTYPRTVLGAPYGTPSAAPRYFDPAATRVRAAQEPPPPTVSPTPPNPETVANEGPPAVPRSENVVSGGEPTTVTEAEEEAEAPAAETTLLMKLLGMEESPVKIYGWIENSFTLNANGPGKNDINFGVNPNFLAQPGPHNGFRWMGNQYYLVFENPLEMNDQVNFGFRFDNLFGNDWQFNHMQGMFNNSFTLNHFAGYDPAQFYAEVHLPVLTKGGLDIRGGRFYTILGYEVVPAIGRPLVSVPYMFNYGQPFTHTGMLSTLHVTDQINWINGTVNGWDRWLSTHWKWNYIGGVTWTSKDTKWALAISYIFGPDSYPYFVRQNAQIVFPGSTVPPYLAGRQNIGYGGNWRAMFTTVLTRTWTDKLTQVMETDEGYENNLSGLGVGGTSRNESWYSFGNWFLYKATDKLTFIWRAEVFRDDGGARTGFNANFYEQTVGAVWKPFGNWLWFRGEARYDWCQGADPYTSGTRNSQFTLAGEVIFLF
jgi:hypothetical protein